MIWQKIFSIIPLFYQLLFLFEISERLIRTKYAVQIPKLRAKVATVMTVMEVMEVVIGAEGKELKRSPAEYVAWMTTIGVIDS